MRLRRYARNETLFGSAPQGKTRLGKTKNVPAKTSAGTQKADGEKGSDFVEAAREKRLELVEQTSGGGFVVAARLERQLRAVAGGEHHQTHDALPVDALVVLRDVELDVRIFVRDADDHRRWTRVNAHLVLNDKFSGERIR